MGSDKLTDILKTTATIVGIVTISAPVLNVILMSGRASRRSTGAGRKLRTWQSVVLMAVGFVGLGILFWQPINFPLNESLSTTMFIGGTIIYFGGTSMYLWGWAIYLLWYKW